ncbi:MAG: Re/Si-specific NAD(P)(+) transhydrogenase subunit alpha [Verrucomicrobiae bacterium]|nr:Re/Si-specific NAD(P)(+) transhydrogenase subunit alpha [Verrucomicrobiae bacterium]
MLLFFPKENHPSDKRIALTPDAAKRLATLGITVEIEKGLGAGLGYSDESYEKVGAKLSSDRAASSKNADMVLRLRKPASEDIALLKKGAIHVSYLDPFNESSLIQQLAQAQVSAVSMEMIPRTTLAQKMDALSSQANLAGYVAVILAAERLDKVFPMMMTPAGTLNPARVFIIGVGVAGLQAIATAKRLGARVEAFDTRPVVEEQVQSLGAKFVKVDLGETGQTAQGYAKELTPEQLEKQRQAMAKVCSYSDVVITTAQVFGRKAPRILTRAMVEGMQPGSIVIDMAVETGGNVEGSQLDQEVDINGVRVIGLGNLPGRVPIHASQMYASNVANFIEHFWDKKEKVFRFNTEDEILKNSLMTCNGQVVNEVIKKHLNL